MGGPFDALTGYELRHLPRHLARAGLCDDLHRLLRIEHEPEDRGEPDAVPRLTGRSINAWYTAVTRDGDLRGYLDHLQIANGEAEQAAETALGAGRPGTELSREFQYALSAASVRNVAANVSVRLLTSMARRGLLARNDALSYVRQIPDPRERAEGLTTLLPVLDETDTADVAGEALAAVSTVQDEFWRVGELGRLAPSLPPWMFSQAEMIAEAVGDPYYRAVALSIIGKPVGSELQSTLASRHFHRKNIMATEYELRDVAPSFRAEFAQRRAQAVTNLGAFLRRGGRDSIPSPYWLTETYAALADESEDYLTSAVSVAGTIGGQAAHMRLAAAVARRFAEAGDVAKAQALLADEVRDVTDLLLIRCELAHESVSAAEIAEQPDPWIRLRAFRARLPLLGEEDRKHIIEALLAPAANDHLTADGLVTAAPYLDHAGWEAALRAAGLLRDDEQRMRVRGALVVRGLALGRADALELLSDIGDEYWYSHTLDQVVAALVQNGRADEALPLARTAPYPHRRIGLMAACAAAMPQPGRAAVLAAARQTAAELTAPTAKARALLLLVGALEDADRADVLADAVDAALAVETGNEPLRSGAIAAIASCLARCGDVEHALDLADEITDEYWLATALQDAAGHATAAHLPRILVKARSVHARGQRGRVLTALACQYASLGVDRTALHERWREVLQTFALGERAEFLANAIGLLPVAEALGGLDTLADVVRASNTIMRWWP
jgi:hypothetical protein